MSEYWKSTPSFWCKFCSQYVRDTNIERKNHEATAKHQNNIQRSLRELHKTHEREKREKQWAKDEVARLNSLVSDKAGRSKPSGSAGPAPQASQPPPSGDAAAQRRAHAEQLAALGVELPEELKKEVTGVGSYHVVSERAVEGGAVTVNRSLADILAENRKHDYEAQEEIKLEDEDKDNAKPRHKRKAEDDEDLHDEEDASKRRTWGSSTRTYPRAKHEDDSAGDLDALLGGIKKNKPPVKPEKTENLDFVKKEGDDGVLMPLDAVPDVDAPSNTAMKPEGDGSSTPAAVFKKRKAKK